MVCKRDTLLADHYFAKLCEKGKMVGKKRFLDIGSCAPPKCKDDKGKKPKTKPTTLLGERPTPDAAVETTNKATLDDNGVSVGRNFDMGGTTTPTRPIVSPKAIVSVRNTTATEQWVGLQEAGLNEQGRQHQIKKFVKETLFPHIKFFVNEEELIWNPTVNSPCQFVVTGLNVSNDPEECRHWWHKHHSLILKEVNRKRSDVVAGIKKIFLGK
jgi:hypothetical protein